MKVAQKVAKLDYYSVVQLVDTRAGLSDNL